MVFHDDVECGSAAACARLLIGPVVIEGPAAAALERGVALVVEHRIGGIGKDRSVGQSQVEVLGGGSDRGHGNRVAVINCPTVLHQGADQRHAAVGGENPARALQRAAVPNYRSIDG